MPRAPQPGREIRRRSRNGCWNCKARKVKCGEEKPRCANCTRLDEDCDYKIRLSWGGRPLKKKLLEQGAQLDDPSQNIPGAGQFSINQFNPVPSQSQQQRMNAPLTPTTPANPRPSNMRKSSKTSPTKSGNVLQNVFPACGVTSQPLMTNTATVASSPFYVSPTYHQHPHHSMYPGLWTSEGEHQQPLTPATLQNESQFTIKDDAFSSFHGTAAPYATQMASPTPSLSNVAMSPDTANSSMPSPQQGFAEHVIYNQQPMIAGSSPERIKSSSSPEIQYRMMPHESTSAMSSGIVVPSSGSLGQSLDYMTGPLTPPQMSTDVQPFPLKENARRLSVQNLLTTPLPSQHDFSTYNQDGYNQTAIDPSLSDEGVEEIPRYDEKKYPNQQPFLGASGPLGSVNSHPVYQSIPRSLHPLPSMLMDNVESAMYFHHFLTHTASLLVPHDCGRNPFKTILPQMAMQKDSLLNLLLAYSASHQSRLLNRAEPTERISGFLGETVRSLTESLNDPVALKSDATLATAIMLCSYEIISPNSFAEGITWQTHLNAVRKIILARGGAEQMHSRDEVSYFLSRWFAYLDVIGSLSGKDTHPLFKGDYWILDDPNGTTDFSVDCFFGTTNRFVSLLAQVGDLARRCDERKRLYLAQCRQHDIPTTASEWMPEGEIYQEAVRLKNELDESRLYALETCTNRVSEDDDDGEVRPEFDIPALHERDQQELLATNDAYHWAAQVHLARRVFNFPTEHAAVQDQVCEILGAMDKVSDDGAAINCWLFPMFMAGCESVDDNGRDKVLQKMFAMERSGLTQIKRARVLMEKVWESGDPWETLVEGEFIG